MKIPDWKAQLVVFVAAVLVFANSLGNGFVSDDAHTILRHPHIKDPSHLAQIFTSGHYEGKGGYRPVVTLSYALNYWVGAESPLGYHLVNILLHACNSVLFYLICRALFSSRAPALVAALLFAVHPAHAEAVAWTSGRAELLGALFFFSAWLAYLRGSVIPSLALFFLALLSKENTLLLPVVLAISDHFRRNQRRAWPRYILYVLVIAAYMVMRDALYRFPLLRNVAKIEIMDNPLVSASLADRLCTALKILGDYMVALFWPLHLAPDYSFNQIPIIPFVPIFAILLILASLAAAGLSYRKGGVAWLGVLIFFVMIAPVSNVLTIIGTIKADRFLYLPSIGFCIVAGAALMRLPRYLTLVAGVAFLAFGGQTVARNEIWKNETAVWREAVRVSPQSAKGHYNLGYQQLKAGQNAQAAKSFEKAVAIYPDFALARLNLGVALIYAGAPAEALRLYNESSAMFATNADFYVNRGLAYMYTGQRNAAADDFRHALRLNPALEDAAHNLDLLGMKPDIH